MNNLCDKVAIEKTFLNYDEQIEKLKSKKLSISDEDNAKLILKQTSYFSLATGYKDIFKDKSTGFYKSECKFEDLVSLYYFDEELRTLFLRFILIIERAMKSQFSYVFCERFGELQDEYLNVNNYNYENYQTEINELVGILRNICTNKNSSYDYIRHNICKYSNVPLWVLVNALTLGNISKMYDFSKQSLQSAIAKDYKDIYPQKLSAMLSVLSKFRNVCAHNERLYNYRTQKSIKDLPIHNELNIIKNGQEFAYGKCCNCQVKFPLNFNRKFP